MPHEDYENHVTANPLGVPQGAAHAQGRRGKPYRRGAKNRRPNLRIIYVNILADAENAHHNLRIMGGV